MYNLWWLHPPSDEVLAFDLAEFTTPLFYFLEFEIPFPKPKIRLKPKNNLAIPFASS